MDAYKCPLCGKMMERDLVLFRDHTNEHVIDEIKGNHPEWVESDGACQPCVEYFERQLSGNLETQNIGPRGRLMRAIGGSFVILLSFAAAGHFIFHDWPRYYRMTVFVPLFLGVFGIIQARERVCAVLAMRGARNMDKGELEIDDEQIAAKLKARGQRILLQSALIALVLTAIIWLFPG